MLLKKVQWVVFKVKIYQTMKFPIQIPKFDIIFNSFREFYLRIPNRKSFDQVVQEFEGLKFGTPNVNFDFNQSKTDCNEDNFFKHNSINYLSE